jgi:hypothetical protein
MSTAEGGGDIVRDGLVFYVDAANPRSYVSGSTIWNDLSRGGNNGTLTNGPTFNSGNGGSIVFDGTNNYVNNIGNINSFSFIQNTGIYTLSAWVKPAVLGTNMYFAGNNSGTRSEKGFYFGKQTTNDCWLTITNGGGSNWVLNHSVANFFLNTTEWVNVICVGNGTINQFYRNGIAFGGTSNITNLTTGTSSQVLVLGSINNVLAFNYWWSGNISSFQIYNRALSSTEILQNFNATRARFGV